MKNTKKISTHSGSARLKTLALVIGVFLLAGCSSDDSTPAPAAAAPMTGGGGGGGNGGGGTPGTGGNGGGGTPGTGGNGGGMTPAPLPDETLPDFAINAADARTKLNTNTPPKTFAFAAPSITGMELQGIADDADTVFSSDIAVVQKSSTQRARRTDGTVTCTGGSCPDITLNNVTSFGFDLDDVGDESMTYQGYSEETEAVMTYRNSGRRSHVDVPIFQGRAAGRIVNENAADTAFTSQSYGGWFGDSAFGVTVESIGNFDYYVARSFGDNTGSNPTGDDEVGIWRGTMVGVNPESGEFIQGIANITIGSLANPKLEVGFNSIKNLATGAALNNMSWSDIVPTNGTFSATNSNGGTIQGSFYGANHAEAGGVFDQTDYIGSFGVKKSGQ